MNNHQSSPRVSVCISSYNHARFLPIVLDSVLAQTFKDFEIVLVDDGSSDDSLKIALDYCARHPSIMRVLTHPNRSNRGISATANLAFQESKAEYLAWQSSDDVWYPQKLEWQVAFLEKHPKVGFVYGLAHIVDGMGQRMPGTFGTDVACQSDPVATLIQENVIPAMMVLFRRQCLEDTGLLDETLVYSDWELWIRMMAHWDAGFIDAPVGMYRVHGSNTSVGIEPKVNLEYRRDAFKALRRKASGIGGVFNRLRLQALIDLQLAYILFCLGEKIAATQSLMSALETDATLQTDPGYIANWLKARQYGGLKPLLAKNSGGDFNSWMLENLPSTISASSLSRLRKKVDGLRFSQAAFDSYHTKDLARTRRMALHCLKSDPCWLVDRALLSMLTETVIGPRFMTEVRRLKRRLLKGRVDVQTSTQLEST